MANLISTDLLPGARASLASVFTDVVTITRTGLTVPCAVLKDAREIQPVGQPEFMRLRRWQILTPYGTDVRGGDIGTVTGKGVYIALEAVVPETYGATTLTYAVQSRHVDGSINLYTNATVGFDSTKTAGQSLTNIPVAIAPMSMVPHLHDQATEKDWVAYFDPQLRYPNGTTQVIAGDYIDWGNLHGDTARLSSVRTLPDIRPVAYCLFSEQS